ncbi:MAG: chorismate lyase [Gammaproteobacteria bacterium]
MPAHHFQSRWLTRRQLFNKEVPHALLDWLFDSSSLTARLQRRCPGQFRVELISQKIEKPRLDEISVLDLHYGDSALVRQVRLFCADIAVVYARTVIPLATLSGKERSYANLGNRPLGAMLFADQSMRRGRVMVSRLNNSDVLFKHTGVKQGDIWGRRSVFYVSEKPLLVSEYYLPALTAV